MNTKLVPLLLVLSIVGCNSSSDDNKPVIPAPVDFTPVTAADENLQISINSAVTEFNVLFMGNSHVLGLAKIMRTLFEMGAPQKNIDRITESTGDFLAERLDENRSIDIVKSYSWSHVIFQAQKYSQSGLFEYPTIGAQTWIKMAKSQGATPILFPEHPQRGDGQEGQKVHDLHVSIANIQSSCVAPVGLVWDRVIRLMPGLELHLQDGNHASYMGKFLTALVFYEIITGLPADLVPYNDTIDIDVTIQDFMGQIVTEVIAENPPCEY